MEHYKNEGIDPKSICKDGILNEVKFQNVKPKVLFILKEVNDFKEGDLREMLKDGPVWQMWHTIARWAAGIINDFPPYNEIDNSESLKENLSKIAAINLKKASGGASANLSKINAYAHLDKNLLREQIKMIRPDIIIACGTFDILIWLLNIDVKKVDNPYEEPVYDEERNIWVIPWRHPGRANNEETYEELKKLIAEINKRSPVRLFN